MKKQRLATSALMLMVALPSLSQAVELTTNGGFETGTFAGWTQFPSGPNQTITNVSPSSGVFAAEIFNTVAASNSLMKQANIGIGIVTAGQTVNISFDAKGEFGNGGVAFAEFFSELAGGGVSSSQILGGAPLNVNANSWTTFNYTVTTGANVSGGVTLQLGATTGAATGSFAHVFYDNVSVTAVPEPATMTALGVGALALIRRRKNKS